MILLDEGQVEDCRSGIEKELCQKIGYFISIRVHPDEDLKFIAKDLPIEHRNLYDEICREHIIRVSSVGFDS